jgi:hypothetical protein
MNINLVINNEMIEAFLFQILPAGKYIARENNTDQIMVNRQISMI